MKAIKIISTLIVLIGLAGTTQAGTQLATISPKASASLAATCTISSQSLVFGSIGTAPKLPTTATASVTVLCTRGTAYSTAIGQGLNGNRSLKGVVGKDFISYYICSADNWSWDVLPAGGHCYSGQGWWSGGTVDSSGTGTLQTFPMYGFVPNGYYRPDNYTDTLVVSLSY